jgi:hypothetical protein
LERSLLAQGRLDTTTVVEISVVIYFTDKFAEMEPDIQAGNSPMLGNYLYSVLTPVSKSLLRGKFSAS